MTEEARAEYCQDCRGDAVSCYVRRLYRYGLQRLKAQDIVREEGWYCRCGCHEQEEGMKEGKA